MLLSVNRLTLSFGPLVVAIVMACTPSVQAATLISHYKFDGDTLNAVVGAPDATRLAGGDSTFDTGQDGTANGAVVFDGNSDNVLSSGMAGQPNSSAGLLNGSASLWFKGPSEVNGVTVNPNLDPTSGGGQNGSPVAFLGTFNDGSNTLLQLAGDYAANSSAQNRLLHGYRAEDPDPMDTANDTIVNNYGNLGDDQRWNDDQWHHIAFTWSITVGAVTSTMYLDGVMTDDGPVTSTLSALQQLAGSDYTDVAAWQYDMLIGGASNRGTTFKQLVGLMDDLRIYDGELTQGEVRELAGVPEPSSLLMVGMIAGGGLAMRRRPSSSRVS